MRFFLHTVKLGLGFLLVMEMLALSGCDRHELENNAFPLALGIETEEDASASGEGARTLEQSQQEIYHMYAAYPNLQDKDAKENALASDLFWDDTMENLTEGTTLMSENSSRNVDLNHLKVLILDKAMLDDGENTDALIAFFEEKRDASWNTYVLLCDGETADLFSGDMQMNSCLGIYLEDILEGWTNLKPGVLVTVGDLVSRYYNANETLLIPIVTVEDQRPVVNEFAVVENLEWTSERAMEEVFADL